ncbi:MAG: hypothetical protein ABIQ84_07570 [Usitatibacter sp.]
MRSALGKLAFAAILMSLTWVAPAAWAQEKDLGMGTWKLNLAKSKYKPGPPPKSLVVKFEPAGKGVKTSSDFVNAQGEKTTAVYTAQYDGKDYPITGSATADTVALMKLAGGKIERVDKKGGKRVQTFVRSVSADGKTMTIAHKGKNAKGEPFDNVLVLEK